MRAGRFSRLTRNLLTFTGRSEGGYAVTRLDDGEPKPVAAQGDAHIYETRPLDPRRHRKVLSAVQQISTLRTESILDGSLRPGDRLPTEDVMAENHGVSRPTMRLALRALRVKGAIRVVRGPKGGHIVEDFAPATIADGLSGRMSLALDGGDLAYAQISEVRDELEVLSARLAAQRRTASQADDLRALDDQVGVRPTDQGINLEEAVRYDMHFHRRLAECTNNPLIVAFASGTIIAFQDRDIEPLGFDGERLLVHLDVVRDAVTAGNSAAAEAAMRRHLIDARPPRDRFEAPPTD